MIRKIAVAELIAETKKLKYFLFVFSFVISVIISFVTTFVRHFNLQVSIENNTLEIDQGLITKQNNIN